MASAETMDKQDHISEFGAGAAKVRKELSQAGDKMRKQAENAWDELVDTIREHPGKALGVTLAAGFAVGTLLGASTRRRSSIGDPIRGLAGSGAEAWDRLRSGFEEAACSLKEAVDDAVNKFK